MESTFDDAVKAYEKFCKKYNIVFEMPSENYSEIDRENVYLKNSNGDIGTYHIQTKQFKP